MRVKVSVLTVVLFAIIAVLGDFKDYLTVYIIMIFHEAAHLVAALLIGLKPDCVLFAPFGVNLKLKNKIVYSLSEEVILYLSGPLLNGILSLVGLYMQNREFYQINTVLMIMNLLPILPLDGGMIFLRVISEFYSRHTAERLLIGISCTLTAILLVFACIGLWYGYINISLFIMSVFFLGNILTAKKMYDTNLLYALNSSKKKTNKVRVAVIDNDHSAVEALKNISPQHTTLAVEFYENGEFKRLLSEKSLIEVVNTGMQ